MYEAVGLDNRQVLIDRSVGIAGSRVATDILDEDAALL